VAGQLPISESTLKMVQEGLFLAVNKPRGTAWASRLDIAVMCGKTGTAQVVGRRENEAEGESEAEPIKDHAWFVAYAPRENPVIAVAVIVEHGEHGSSAAAPVAAKMIRLYLTDRNSGEDASRSENQEPVDPAAIGDATEEVN